MGEVELDDAIERSKRNRACQWPVRSSPNRLEPECWPEVIPNFNLVPGSTVFAIGSCFARSVETHLKALGFDVPTRTFLDNNPRAKHLTGDEILNKYTPPSIYQELLWAKTIRDRDGVVSDADIQPFLLELGDGSFVDLQRAFTSHYGISKEDALLQRRNLYKLFEKVFDCDVVVITLGFIECWLDRATGQYVQFGTYLRKHNGGNRFAFKRLNFKEAYEYTRKSIDLIDETGTKPVLITTSPVPLVRTFTADDVIIANSYSKSVLRAVAGQIADECPNVDYFPSYENVMLTKQDYVWVNDLIHVEPEFVGRIMGRLCERYVANSENLPQISRNLDKRMAIAGFAKHGRFDDAREIFEKLTPNSADMQDGAYAIALAEMHLHFGDRQKAVENTAIAQKLTEGTSERDWLDLLRCARVFEAAGHATEAAAARAAALKPVRSTVQINSMISKLILSGMLDEARAVMDHVEKSLSDNFDLLGFVARTYERIGDHGAAERTYRAMLPALENALALDPANEAIFKRLIAIVLQLKQVAELERHALQFIAAAPKNPLGHMYLASSFKRRHRRSEALVHARRAAELEPGNERYTRYAEELARPVADSNRSARLKSG
jgi:tetratricopeptide (TPR) repeat protein